MEFFKMQELVSPKYYKIFGDSALRFVDPAAQVGLVSLRQALGVPIIINTWHSKALTKRHGKRVASGLRDMTTKVGAQFSMHKFGKAFDLKVPDMDLSDVLEVIKQQHRLLGITRVECLEETETWLHIEFNSLAGFQKELNIFKP